MKIRVKIEAAFVALVIAFCGGLGVLTADNHEKRSEIERRNYTQFPQLHWKSLFNTKYLKQVETAFTDQIQYRERFVHQYYSLLHTCGLSYLNDMVIGKDDQLFCAPSVPDDLEKRRNSLIDAAKLVNEEAAKISALGKTFIYIHYPRKDAVMEEYLPWYYPASSEGEEVALFRENLSEDVLFIDARDLFLQNKKAQPFYYQTDHHANFDGQMLVYQELMGVVSRRFPDMPIYTKVDYILTLRKVDGAYNRSVGNIVTPMEEPLNVEKGPAISYQRWDMDKESDRAVFGNQDTYEGTFMGGNIGHTLIETTQYEGPSFLISGTSFTNTLEALVIPVSRRMESLDFRNLKGDKTLVDYATDSDADYVILIASGSYDGLNPTGIRQQLGLS